MIKAVPISVHQAHQRDNREQDEISCHLLQCPDGQADWIETEGYDAALQVSSCT